MTLSIDPFTAAIPKSAFPNISVVPARQEQAQKLTVWNRAGPGVVEYLNWGDTRIEGYPKRSYFHVKFTEIWDRNSLLEALNISLSVIPFPDCLLK